MNVKYTVTIIVIVILALLGFIIREYSPSNKQGVKKIYYADNISAAQKRVISEFNKKYQNRIEVISIDLPFTKFTTNERKEILTRSLRSKTERIDVFAVDLIWGPRFAKWAYDLSPYFNKEFLSNLLDHTVSSDAYAKGYDSDPRVIRDTMMWEDNILALYQQNKILDMIPKENLKPIVLFNDHLNPVISDLRQKYKD